MKKTFYITTPIYYPSGNWHIGTCYTTVVCDAIARFKRMCGYDVFFSTGTDEHGQKIQERARLEGKNELEYINPIVDDLKSIWSMLNISYDRFVRTTDSDHVKTVQGLFTALYEKGEIYKSQYEGWYCTPCEAFWTESQLKEGKCPDCGRDVHLEREESYFFRLSKYADRLKQLFLDNPEFLQPKSRVNEMINNFIDKGLTDLCVSRTSVKWGIPVDFDKKHVVYVWVDALPNYLTAIGYGENEQKFNRFWPCDLHMVGKEIVRFHAIIWPAILMALDLPLPNRVYGHGWLLIGGDKLSKSKSGNINTELIDPKEIVSRYGSDALRYFLMREIPFGNDGNFSNEILLTRINSDLANDLGNLVTRTTAMIHQYFGGALPEKRIELAFDREIIDMSNSKLSSVTAAIDEINVPKALSEIFKLVSRSNKYIDETMPWVLAKDAAKKDELAAVLYNLSEFIRISAVLLMPFLPKTTAIILDCFSIDANEISDFDKNVCFGVLKSGTAVKKCQPIFPRIDIKKELAAIDELMIKRAGQKQVVAKKCADSTVANNKTEENNTKSQITIDEFMNTELRVAKVVGCECVKGSDKLLKLELSLGGEIRTVLSGIREHYSPDDLIGRKVVLVANLKPVKIRGILSQGMILCAENDGRLSVVTVMQDILEGSKIR